MTHTPTLQITGLTFGYGRRDPILCDINLTCYPGRIYGLFGNNGSGKTTLFNLICGFTGYQTGQISYYGQFPSATDPLTICSFGGGLTRTFQTPVLVDELSVRENLYLAFRNASEGFSALLRPRREINTSNAMSRSAVERYLEEFALSDARDSLAGVLSYGRRRIVANLIALLHDSKTVLLDEPFANLHSTQVELLKSAIRREALEREKCVLIIEHSPHYLTGSFLDSLFLLRRTLRTHHHNGDSQAMINVLHSFIYSDD